MSLSLELKAFLVDCPVLPHSCCPPPRLSAEGMRRDIPGEMQGPGFLPREGYLPGVVGLGTQPQLGLRQSQVKVISSRIAEGKKVNREYTQPEMCGRERQELPPVLPW